MKKTRQLIFALCLMGMLLSLICAVLSFLAREGFQHAGPASTARQAGEDLQAGRMGEAGSGFFLSTVEAVDAGLRYTILPIYSNQMVSAQESGNLQQALDVCLQATDMLGRYDEEGAFMYYCNILEEKIRLGH